MDGTAARQEADKILAELPDRTTDASRSGATAQSIQLWCSAMSPGPRPGWRRSSRTRRSFKLYDIRPGDRVMIVSENGFALVALILAASELDA